MVEYIFGFVIYAFVAIFMMGIGIVQLKSKKPVAFYSGEKPPRAEDVTDVNAWNKKHGLMWIVYAVVIVLSYFAGMLIGDSVWSVIPMVGGVVVPIPFMIRYHNRLRKEYLK
ncbi:MAG: hypothetical protein ACI4S1_13280 [Roseburia sp.]